MDDKHVIRLIVNRELSDEEISEYFDIVDEIVETENVNVMEDTYDTQVAIYDDDGVYTYEIPVQSKVDEEESYDIVQEVADMIPDDFQVETL